MTAAFLGRIILLAFILTAGLRAQTATLAIVEENGPRSKRINLVFLSEGYTAAELPSFAAHVNAAVAFLFSKEPWQQYRSYCNVYRIEIASNQSGCDNGDKSGPGGVRDTYFSAGFTTSGVPQLLTLSGTGSSRAYSLLNSLVPEYDQCVVLVNDPKYGGAGGSIAVASVHAQSAAIVEHEIGHSFAGLADEYDIEYSGYTPSEQPNNTAVTARASIRWNAWIDAPTPLATPETAAYDNVVGLFEGSMYRTTGWYRPHHNSVMRNLDRPCGVVNREKFVLTYYERISPVDASSPGTATRTITNYQDLSFSVTPKVPSSGVGLLKKWRIDNVEQAGATGSAFITNSDRLGNGTHTVSVVVRDPTAFVRVDPAGLLDDTVTWTFVLSNQLPPDLAAWRAAYGSDTGNSVRDGLNNLLKYALGIDPTKRATPAQNPWASLGASGASTFLRMNVPRRSKRTDVAYVVEVSSDMVNWNSGPGHTVTEQDTSTLLVVRDATPTTSAAKRFIRLKVREL
jgi:hypothetical protein